MGLPSKKGSVTGCLGERKQSLTVMSAALTHTRKVSVLEAARSLLRIAGYMEPAKFVPGVEIPKMTRNSDIGTV